MFPLFTTTDTLLPLILTVVAFAMWSQKVKALRKVGPPLICVLLGIILSNTKIVPPYQDIYGTIFTYCVPLATSLYLLNMDLSQLKKMSKQPLIAIACAIFSVSIAAVIFGLVFSKGIEEGWKIAGMFVGTYTGGSSNLTAIAVGLQATEGTIGAANAADYVVGIPTMVLMFAAPALLRNSKWFQKKWPYRFTEEEYAGSDGTEFMADEKWNITDIAILLAISFSIVALSTWISGLAFGAGFASAGRILLISTFSLIAAQIPAVKRLRGQFNLGLFFSLTFLVVIGFMVDINAFFGSTLSITLFCLSVVLFSIILHLVLLRLFKIKYEYAVLSITGAIADGPTSALVAAGGGWKNLVGIGLLMGLIGAVCGNYVGIGIAYVIKALTGV